MHAAVAVLLSFTLVTADEATNSNQSRPAARVSRPVVTAVQDRPTFEARPEPVVVERRRTARIQPLPAVQPVEVQARLVNLQTEATEPRIATEEAKEDVTEPRRVVVRRSTIVRPADPVEMPTLEVVEPAPEGVETATVAQASPAAEPSSPAAEPSTHWALLGERESTTVARANPAAEPVPVAAEDEAEGEQVMLTARRQTVALQAASPLAPEGLARTPVGASVHPQGSVEAVPAGGDFVEIDTRFNRLSAPGGSVYDYTGYLLNGEYGQPFSVHQQPPRLNHKGRVPLCRSTCNLRQHVEYFPYAHGNYYFRPYTFSRLLQQQEQAARMAIDPRNPYSNKQFLKVYELMDERVSVEEIQPGEIPGEIEGIEGIELEPEIEIQNDEAPLEE